MGLRHPFILWYERWACLKPLQRNLDFFLIRASWGRFRLKHKSQGPSHIHIPKRKLLLRCFWKDVLPLHSKTGNQLSSPDDIGCPGLSSCCFTEIDVPVDLRGVSHWISGLLLRMSSNFLYMIWNERWLYIQWRGNVLHLELIWDTPIYFAFLRWHQCSSLVVTVFLGILFSSIREIEVPYVLDWEHGTPQHKRKGNRASSCGEGEVSWVFSSCGRHLVYILE